MKEKQRGGISRKMIVPFTDTEKTREVVGMHLQEKIARVPLYPWQLQLWPVHWTEKAIRW